MNRPRRPRNPFGPIRVPSGPAGDAFIDFMCQLWGITREEALEAGRRAMRTVFRTGPVIPKPLKAPVGAVFFMDNHGRVNQEALAEATERAEENHTRDCVTIAMRGLDCPHDDIVREVAVRHYYPTRYVLDMAAKWARAAIEKHPDLNDEFADDLRWAVANVLDGADKDLDRLKETR